MRKTVATLALIPALALAACTAAETTGAPSVGPVSAEPTQASAHAIVPDVLGMSAAEARAKLEDAGFVVNTTGDGSDVVQQVPKAGTSTVEGGSVSITVEDPQPEGTRNDPYPAGSVVTGSAEGVDEASIMIGPATWGADEVIHQENRFNDAAPAGSTYVLVPITVTNVGSSDAIVPWLAFDVAYVAPDGRSFDEASVVVPSSLDDIGDLYEGGVGTGNIAFVIPTDAQGGVWAIEYGWSDPVFVAAV